MKDCSPSFEETLGVKTLEALIEWRRRGSLGRMLRRVGERKCLENLEKVVARLNKGKKLQF